MWRDGSGFLPEWVRNSQMEFFKLGAGILLLIYCLIKWFLQVCRWNPLGFLALALCFYKTHLERNLNFNELFREQLYVKIRFWGVYGVFTLVDCDAGPLPLTSLKNCKNCNIYFENKMIWYHLVCKINVAILAVYYPIWFFWQISTSKLQS